MELGKQALSRATTQLFSSADEEYQLWVMLAEARNACVKAGKKELGEYGISGRQAAVLYAIDTIGERATPAEISRWLFRESQSISELLVRMERQGLVKRTKDLERKNLTRVILTEKGRRAYSHSSQRKTVHKIMSCLSRKERDQLRICLLKIWHEALKELGLE